MQRSPLENAVTGYKQSTNTNSDGTFRFDNIPFNNYVYTASASGFGDVRGGSQYPQLCADHLDHSAGGRFSHRDRYHHKRDVRCA